jgi:hypothetical protein
MTARLISNEPSIFATTPRHRYRRAFYLITRYVFYLMCLCKRKRKRIHIARAHVHTCARLWVRSRTHAARTSKRARARDCTRLYLRGHVRNVYSSAYHKGDYARPS